MNVKKSIEQFQMELNKVMGWKKAAYTRMKQQSAAGDLEKANLSRKAYEYCEKYADQLRAIIEGYRKQKSGKIFTKDARERYTEKPELDFDTVKGLKEAERLINEM